MTKRKANGASESGHEHLMEPERLRALAGAGPYERGASYFEEGRVTNLVAQGGRTTATVEGSHAFGSSCGHAEAKRFLRGKLQGLSWQREPHAVTLAAILHADGKTSEAFDTIRGLFERMGEHAFDIFVADLQSRHRAKRNLMSMLDALPGRS